MLKPTQYVRTQIQCTYSLTLNFPLEYKTEDNATIIYCVVRVRGYHEEWRRNKITCDKQFQSMAVPAYICTMSNKRVIILQ